MDASLKSGTGVPPVNHAQDARATFKVTRYQEPVREGLTAACCGKAANGMGEPIAD